MSWLLWVWITYAMGCPTAADEVVNELIQRGDVQSYHCMVSRTDAEAVLVAQIPLGTEQTQPRLRRALVFTLLKESELPWTASTVALLSPADRRLLADGVKAKRGRKSPSELHHRIFENWDWYRPKLGYTDNVLTPVDRANIAIADDPDGTKRAAVNPTDTPSPAEPLVVADSEKQSSCGCTTASPMGLTWGMMCLGLVVAGRRQRR